ncbi:hypothetical protein RMATCC62417_08501 [Rhizopus microsporus]|nr:hypothetical protein RMATCC62417_08501 [Rhizopus microsporus]
MRNNWARSGVGTPAQVEIEKNRSPSHTIIGAIHCTSVIHVVMKKPPHKKQRCPKTQTSKTAKPKKRKMAESKEQRAGNIIIIKEPTIEYIDIEERAGIENSKPVAKGTATAHFVKFMNEFLDIMDADESLMDSYFVMDSCTIHKSHPMMRKIESRGYILMYFPYSPELNSIEQLQNLAKGKMERHRLMTEESLSSKDCGCL